MKRRNRYGTKLYKAWGLSFARSGSTVKPGDLKLRDAASHFSSGASGRNLHRDAADGQAERPSEGDRHHQDNEMLERFRTPVCSRSKLYRGTEGCESDGVGTGY